MTMLSYLDNTRFAAESVIRAYQSDIDELNTKIGAYNRAKNELNGKGDVIVTPANFGEVKPIIETFQLVRALGMQIQVTANELANRQTATDSLCGALLQIAKQGLSVVHGGLPENHGPMVGSQRMTCVVWQARNQAMHWEEGNLRSPVVGCFQTLDADLGGSLVSDIHNRSLASAIIDILQWSSLARYEADMIAMG